MLFGRLSRHLWTSCRRRIPVVAVRTVEADAPLPQATPVDERHGAGAMARFDEGLPARCWLEAYTQWGTPSSIFSWRENIFRWKYHDDLGLINYHQHSLATW